MVIVRNIEYIAQLVGPHHLPVILRHSGKSSVDVIAIGSTRIRPLASLGIGEIVAEGGLENKVLDELILTIHSIETSCHIFTLIIISGGKQGISVPIAYK